MAEALGIHDAMVLANNLFLSSVIVESDNRCLVETCRGSLVRAEIQNIINDIVTLKAQFHLCDFTWTASEGNGAAHCIATLADRGDLRGNWISKPPDCLRKALVLDCQNLRRVEASMNCS